MAAAADRSPAEGPLQAAPSWGPRGVGRLPERPKRPEDSSSTQTERLRGPGSVLRPRVRSWEGQENRAASGWGKTVTRFVQSAHSSAVRQLRVPSTGTEPRMHGR